MVAPGGGHAWLLWGHAWLLGGGCMVVLVGHAWLLWGEHAWLLRGVCMVARGGVVAPGGVCVGYDEIRSMSGRYASYWNAFLIKCHAGKTF